MRLTGTRLCCGFVLLLSVGFAKTASKAPKGGVTTPGIQIPMASLKPEAEISLPTAFEGLLLGDASFITRNGETVLPLNTKTNKLDEAIPGFHKACGNPVSAFGTVWIRNCVEDSIARWDTKAKKLTGSVPMKITAGAMQSSADSVWVLTDEKTTLARIDPDQNIVVAETRLPSGCTSLTSAENSLWVTCAAEGKLLRIEPATNLVKERIEVSAEPVSVAFGESSVWVYCKKEGKVSRVDPKTNKVSATIDLKTPGLAGEIVFGDGFVWVSSPGFPIARLDPASDKVAQQFTGEGGGKIYFGSNAIWVPGLKPNTLSRFDVKRIKATLAD